MDRYNQEFAARLRRFRLETLEQDPHSVFAVDASLCLTYVNPAYVDFAHANGGAPILSTSSALGASLLDAISGPLRTFYSDCLTDVVRKGRLWTHAYECSSPQLYREFVEKVYPLNDGLGLLVVNSLKVEHRHPAADGGGARLDPRRYMQATGLLTQCSNCRRTLRSDGSRIWDWVPSWVERVPENTSHSICPTCFDYYWRT